MWLWASAWTVACQAPLCPLSPGVCSNSCPLSWWCHLTISSSAAPSSFCLQSFPASGSFPISWLFTSGGQSPGASASASVLPMYIQDWFPLGWTGLISFRSKEITNENLLRSQGMPLSALWWPVWGGNPQERGHVPTYSWLTLSCSRN